MRKHRLLPLLLVLPACTDSYTPEPDPGYGELGVGVFLFECPTVSDPACLAGGSEATVFPRAFAVGGRFGLRYDWRDSDDEHFGDPLPQIQSSSPQLLTRAGDGFTAVVPGYAAVLAVTGDSEVVDIRHIYLAEVDALQVVPLAEPLAAPLLELALEPGQTADLVVRPVDVDDVPLSGRLEYTWSTSDLLAVDITGGGDSGRVTLTAFDPGQSTVTVTLGALTTQVLVTVGATDPTTGDTLTTGDTTDSTDSSGSSSDSSGDSSGGSSGSSGDSTGETTASTSSTGGAL